MEGTCSDLLSTAITEADILSRAGGKNGHFFEAKNEITILLVTNGWRLLRFRETQGISHARLGNSP